MRPPSLLQFERTKPLRLAAYRSGELSRRRRILEVGAGECSVAEEAAARTGRRVWALDLAAPKSVPPGVAFCRGEAHRLPVGEGTLDALLFHFVLLWLRDPVRVLREARRALAPGGVVLLLAEPDLTARRDEPETGLGPALREAILRSGGSPDAGARIGFWLREAGFRAECHTTPPEWVALDEPAEALHEIEALAEAGLLSSEEASRMAEAERAAESRRVLLPVTWAVGQQEG